VLGVFGVVLETINKLPIKTAVNKRMTNPLENSVLFNLTGFEVQKKAH